MMPPLRWYHYLAWFFGGLFLTNSIPHLVAGLSGSAFQSPFASPPGEGLSSAIVNLLWGWFNLLAAYLLLVRVGPFDLRRTACVVPVAIAMLLIGLQLASHFGRLHGGNL